MASDEQAIFTQPFDLSDGAALGSMDAGSQVWEGRQVMPAAPQGAGAQEPPARQTKPSPHSESWVHGDWQAEPTRSGLHESGMEWQTASGAHSASERQPS